MKRKTPKKKKPVHHHHEAHPTHISGSLALPNVRVQHLKAPKHVVDTDELFEEARKICPPQKRKVSTMDQKLEIIAAAHL